MHYEHTLLFIKEGVNELAAMDKSTEAFFIRLAWFCSFVSYLVAYSYACVRMSMSIPLFFTAKRNFRNDVYVDSVLDNYPVKLFDREKYLEAGSKRILPSPIIT